jgi:hypothetical protein
MGVSTLTRRRSDNPHHVTWHVYFGDGHVGTIGERAGCRSTSINGNGHAASTPACILASIDMVQRQRSRKRALFRGGLGSSLA